MLCLGLEIREIIVLWRVNTLERVISFAVAKKTGKWYQSKIEKSYSLITCRSLKAKYILVLEWRLRDGKNRLV